MGPLVDDVGGLVGTFVGAVTGNAVGGSVTLAGPDVGTGVVGVGERRVVELGVGADVGFELSAGVTTCVGLGVGGDVGSELGAGIVGFDVGGGVSACKIPVTSKL